MTAPEAHITRRFCVHASAEGRAHGRLVDGVSFEDAALGYIEHEHPAADAGDEVSLTVEDEQTGERQCLRIDLETGATTPCD